MESNFTNDLNNYPPPEYATRSVKQLLDLHGRNALVIGGTGHVGSIVVETLVELGCLVTTLDIAETNPQSNDYIQDNIPKGNVKHITCDISDEEKLRNTIKACSFESNKLDIVIHCAGYVGTSDAPGWSVPFESQSAQTFNDALNVNLTSAFIIAQETKPLLDNSTDGSLIFFSSIYALVGSDTRLYSDTGMHNPIGYGVSKSGLLQLTRHLATTMAPTTRVNAISPGGIWRDQPDKFHENYSSKTPLSRMATEEDIKGAVAYLASDLSKYVTGLNLIVDGGWTIW